MARAAGDGARCSQPSGIGDQNAAAPPPAADSIARGEKGADTIARLDAEGPLGGRTILAKSGDKIGKWVRSGSLKETNDRVLDEAVMGKGGGEPTAKFKEQIRDHMERTGRSGFAMLQSILSTLLGDDKMKELPDDYKGVIPENFKMIVEDYAKDTRRQLGAQPKA